MKSSIFNILDLNTQVILEFLKKNQESKALDSLEFYKNVIYRISDIYINNIDKYNRICGNKNPFEWINNKLKILYLKSDEFLIFKNGIIETINDIIDTLDDVDIDSTSFTELKNEIE